jgi:hypothetical protein
MRRELSPERNTVHDFHTILQTVDIYCKVSSLNFKKTDSDFVLLSISDFLTFAINDSCCRLIFSGLQSFLISGISFYRKGVNFGDDKKTLENKEIIFRY